MTLEKKLIYLQYFKELSLPLTLQFDLNSFSENLVNGLKSLGFNEISLEDWQSFSKLTKHNRHIEIEPTTHIVSRSLGEVKEDEIGKEFLAPKGKLKIYKYQGCALLHFSPRLTKWKLSLNDPDSSSSGLRDLSIVFNRIISWALLEQQIVGFWGVPVEQSIVVLSQKESNGEAVFFDLRNQKILSFDGVKGFPSRLMILRLDSTLNGQGRGMAPEELYSFLCHKSTYFDFTGINKLVKNSLTYIVTYAKGMIWSKKSFTSRSDLSIAKGSDKVIR